MHGSAFTKVGGRSKAHPNVCETSFKAAKNPREKIQRSTLFPLSAEPACIVHTNCTIERTRPAAPHKSQTRSLIWQEDKTSTWAPLPFVNAVQSFFWTKTVTGRAHFPDGLQHAQNKQNNMFVAHTRLSNYLYPPPKRTRRTPFLLLLSLPQVRAPS